MIDFIVRFMVDRLAHLGTFGIPVCITIPHFCAVFGYLSLYQFLVAVLSFIGFFLLVMFTWLIWIQVGLLFKVNSRVK